MDCDNPIPPGETTEYPALSPWPTRIVFACLVASAVLVAVLLIVEV